MKARLLLSSLLLGLAIAFPTPSQPAGKAASEERLSYLSELAKRQTSTALNRLLGLIVMLFPVNIAVDQLTDLIRIAEQGLAVALKIDTTEDDRAAGNDCADMTILFARGTTEAGNVGALVGPEFFDEVQNRLGSDATLAIQGIDYAAEVPGFLAGGDAEGSRMMADLVASTLQACPSTKLVMSGYSQGGQLVHNAANLLPAATMARVSSAVIFGDPNNGQQVTGLPASRTKIICHKGDNICEGGALILLPHLTYAEDAAGAAAFVISTAGAIDTKR